MLFSDTAWTITSVPTSIKEVTQSKADLLVFPNPSHDQVFCRLSGGNAALTDAMLYNLLGENVSVQVRKGSENTLSLSVKDISPGIYIVRVIDVNGESYQQKISVMK